jgi:hypothetical protein
MPPIAGIVHRRREPDFWDVLASAFGGYMQGAGKARKAKYNREIVEALIAGKPAGEALEQKEPSGPLASLLNPLNARGTYRGGFEGLDPLTRTLLMAKAGPLVEDPLDRRYRTAQTERTEAMADYYKAGGSRTQINIKPITSTSLDRYSKLMDDSIDAAKEPDWGGYDFTKDALLKQWEKFKRAVGYKHLPDNQQEQLRQRWNTRIATRHKESGLSEAGREYEWDPERDLEGADEYEVWKRIDPVINKIKHTDPQLFFKIQQLRRKGFSWARIAATDEFRRYMEPD